MKIEHFLTFATVLLHCACTQAAILDKQTNRLYNKVVITNHDNVMFKAEILDIIFSLGDTLKINYEVENNRNDTILIFDPSWLYWRPIAKTSWDSTNCQYIYELGGTWRYNLGYNTSLKLISLSPQNKYKHTFYFILNKEKRDSYCNNGINADWKDAINTTTRLIMFYTSFIVKSNDFKINQMEDGYCDFNDDESGFYFEKNMIKLNLGPLWFRILNK